MLRNTYTAGIPPLSITSIFCEVVAWLFNLEVSFHFKGEDKKQDLKQMSLANSQGITCALPMTVSTQGSKINISIKDQSWGKSTSLNLKS